MGDKTGIQWTDKTWNPWRGCDKVSPGCARCYMFTEQTRYGRDPSVVVRTKTWGDPAKWERQAAALGETWRVFTCSWSDWFHETADPWREEAWAVIRRCPHLVFQVLTKRHERIIDHLPSDWGEGYPNVWLGVSVENQHWADVRIPLLLQVPAAVRFVSYEPALGPVEFAWEGYGPYEYGYLRDGLHWVIVGGESGAGARPFDLAWARSVIKQCRATGVACFVKQLGAKAVRTENDNHRYDVPLRDSHGGDWDEWEPDLRVREFPANRLAEVTR